MSENRWRKLDSHRLQPPADERKRLPVAFLGQGGYEDRQKWAVDQIQELKDAPFKTLAKWRMSKRGVERKLEEERMRDPAHGRAGGFDGQTRIRLLARNAIGKKPREVGCYVAADLQSDPPVQIPIQPQNGMPEDHTLTAEVLCEELPDDVWITVPVTVFLRDTVDDSLHVRHERIEFTNA